MILKIKDISLLFRIVLILNSTLKNDNYDKYCFRSKFYLTDFLTYFIDISNPVGSYLIYYFIKQLFERGFFN